MCKLMLHQFNLFIALFSVNKSIEISVANVFLQTLIVVYEVFASSNPTSKILEGALFHWFFLPV